MDGLKILYIEDDAHTATRVKELALSRGDDLHWESDGAAGLRIAGRDRFDVIILDRMLGDDDGLKILARLRAAKKKDATLFMCLEVSTTLHRSLGGTFTKTCHQCSIGKIYS